MIYLTSQERKAIIFILCLVVLGIGVDFIKKKTHRKSLINYEELQDRFFDKIDINRAKFSQLTSIPGVGETLARRIIDYRRAHGDFEDIEEVMNVRGIKKRKFEKLEKYIITNNKGD